MKTNRLLFACGVLVGITASILLPGCKSSSKGASTESGGASAGTGTSKTATNVEFLFVQNAKEVVFNNETMILRGVNPVTVCFADRPERIAGHMPTSKIVPMWSEGTDSFTANPPNATLSILSSGGTIANVVMVLRNPRMTGNDLTYDVRILEGTPAEGGACSLFIDIIGMPLTPYSYAGAARRAARVGYAYPGMYGPAVVPVVHPVVVY